MSGDIAKSKQQQLDEENESKAFHSRILAAVDDWNNRNAWLGQQHESGVYSAEDLKALKLEGETKLANTKKKLEEEYKALKQGIWDYYGWTQEKEEAANLAVAIEEYVANRHDKVDGPKNKASILKNDMRDSKRNVVFSADDERVVSVSANGHVTGYNHVKPHKMKAEERSDAVRAVEDYIRSHTFKELKNKQALEEFVTDAIEEHVLPPKLLSKGDVAQRIKGFMQDVIGSDGTPDAAYVRLTAILLEEPQHNRVLIATDTGAFEVVNVKPDASLPAPVASPVIAQVPASGKGQGK